MAEFKGTRVVSKQQAERMHEQAESQLPPKGYQREELLKMRQDELESIAEQAAVNAIAIDGSVFTPEREIQHALANALTNMDYDNYIYTLVCDRQDGDMIWLKENEGWEMVHGDPKHGGHKEAPNLMHADGTRKIGDARLMRIPKLEYAKWWQKQVYKAKQRDATVSSQLIEVGNKVARESGGKVKLTDPRQRMVRGGQSLMDLMEGRAAARRSSPGIRQQAAQMVGDMVKDGTVPGVKNPGQK